MSSLSKNTIREILRSPGRFLAILAIIVLGSGFFVGLRVSQKAMTATADTYLEKTSFYDFSIATTLGLTEEDVKALLADPDVLDAEGSFQADALVNLGGGTDVVFAFYSLPERINTPDLLEGRLPSAPDECLADSWTNLSIGDKVTVSAENGEDTLDRFAVREFTVTGIAISPLYLNFERGSTSLGSGSVTAFCYIPLSAFDTDYYTAVYLRAPDMPRAYSDAYDKRADALEDHFTALAEARADARYRSIIADAEAELADGWAEYNDAEAEYLSKRADAEAELADALRKLEDAKAELDSAARELEDGWREYNDGLTEFETRRADGEKELRDAKAALADALKALEEGEAEYADSLKLYEDGQAAYADGAARLEEARRTLEDAERQYEDGLAEYRAGLSGYNAGMEELSAGKVKLDESEALLNAQQEQFDLFAEGLIAGLRGSLGSFPYDSPEALFAVLEDPSSPNYGFVVMAVNMALGAAAGQTSDAALPRTVDELLEAKDQLAAGWAAYNAGLEEYRRSAAYLNFVHAELTAAKRTLDASRRELDEGWAELEENQRVLADSRRQLDDAKRELDMGRSQLDDGWSEYYDGIEDYEAGLEEFNTSIAQAQTELADAKLTLEDAERQYADGLKEYENGLKEYDDARAEVDAEFADAEAKLADARAELDEARQEIDDIAYPDVWLLGRWSNLGYVCFENDASIVRSISTVFPVFFFLVAALICVTTVSRMVEEQRSQLGVLMALGYSRLKVMGKFLIYSGSATVIGCVSGILLGSRMIPLVVWQAYKIMYSFSDKIEFYYDFPLSTVTFALYLAAMMAVTWLSCRKEIRDVPANVIRPKPPKAGKRVLLERVPLIWNRLSFLWKVTVRNIFRYKLRVLMMILGIAGCTALMLTGMGVNDSIKNVVDYQFTEISLYDYSVTFTRDLTKEEREDFLAQAGGFAEDALFFHQTSVTAVAGHTEKEVHLSAVDVEHVELIGEFMDFHKGLKKLDFPGKGEALVNSGLAKAMGLKPGDTLELRTENGPNISVTVSGVYDNYIYNTIYVRSDTLPGEQEINYALVVKNDSADTGEALARILGMDNVLTASASLDLRARIGSMMESLIYIVLLTVICAAALAFVVIYNLTNINIQERLREIATVKVLGFYNNESALYVLRENILLTLLGAAAGVPLGIALNAFVIGQIELDIIHFTPRIALLSYLASIALTILFSLLVDLFMHRRLNSIDPASALKAAE